MSTKPSQALLFVAATAILWTCCGALKDDRDELLKLIRSRRRAGGADADIAQHISQPHGQDGTGADEHNDINKTMRPYVCKFSSQRGRNALITKSETFNDDLADTYGIVGGVMSEEDLQMMVSARSEDIGIEKCEPDHEMSLMDEVGDIYATTTALLNATRDGQEEGDPATTRGRTLNIPELTETQVALNMIRVMDGTRRIVAQGPHKVKVCIADTGFALGHSGLPFSRSQVTGSDTLHHRNTQYTADDVLYRWDEDANGHGSHIAGIVSFIC